MKINSVWLPFEKNLMLVSSIVIWVCNLAFVLNLSYENKNQIIGLDDGFFSFKKDTLDNEWYDFVSNFLMFLIFSTIFNVCSYFLKQWCFSRNKTDHIFYFYFFCGNVLAIWNYKTKIIYLYLLTFMDFVIAKKFHTSNHFFSLRWGISIGTIALIKSYTRFNIYYTYLRVLSYSLDMHWSYKKKEQNNDLNSVCYLCNNTHNDNTFFEKQVELYPPMQKFNLLNYYAYVFYPPLFINGPILGFHCWLSQITPKRTLSVFPWKKLFVYACKLMIEYIVFEIATHFIFPTAILMIPMNENLFLSDFYKTFMLGIFYLYEIWFKHVLLWRFHRWWALLDAIETPEDMSTCILDKYSLEGFWRNWHSTLNFWILRYLYFPLGGSKCSKFNKFRNTFCCFAFVAITHTLTDYMGAWLLATVAGFILEAIVRDNLGNNVFLNKFWVWKYVCAWGSGYNYVVELCFNFWSYGFGTEQFLKIFSYFINWKGVGSLTLISLMFIPHIVTLYSLKR